MIATARVETLQDPADLAVRLAKTRVALAAFKQKHTSEEVEDEDVAYAAMLRDYYLHRLQADEAVILNEQIVPREDVRQILQTVLSQYGSEPREVTDKDALERTVDYLERLISKRLSGLEAGELIKLLNQQGKPPQPPNYEPDVLSS
ncbi:MAG TPA: hypothetical protein VF883_19790 [Thermoanaerobaculia bacterium]|jgi:DNA replicative helicase MCM subunit Mcm2 (Cdc46/Mcm family)